MSERNKRKKKQIIDLSRFLEPEMSVFDENGSYTGVTKETYYDADMDEAPIQDADDL
ncbi:MAG: hypothetical protein K6C14_08365 [Eubacterium sp.]|nr:hypothetical protein [Eubacterium sp.]